MASPFQREQIVVRAIRTVFGKDIPPGTARKRLVESRQKMVDMVIEDFDRARYRELLNNSIRQSFYRLVDRDETKEDVNLLKSVPFGTKQWSDASYNIRKSDSLCPHGCYYCYVLPIINKNFQHVDIGKFMNDVIVLSTFIEDRSERELKLPCMEIDWNKVMKGWARGKPKLVMTPTSHDVVPGVVNVFIVACLKMLEAGHSLLITTKPRMTCVEKMCNAFNGYKDGLYKERVMFRFTMTTHDQSVKDTWEPLAPTFEEGIKCIDIANKTGIGTSISMEPFLKDPVGTAGRLAGLVTGEIWIGMMNGFPSEKVLGITLPSSLKEEITRLKETEYTFENISRVVNTLRQNEKIHWKESIINMYLKERGY